MGLEASFSFSFMPDLIELPYCPHCGAKSFKSGPFKPWHCESCGFLLYPNIASAVGVFIVDEGNQVLFTERAHEPSQGKLGIPGGFLDAGEKAETGVEREIFEEIGLKVNDLHYLCSFPNKYFYGGILYDTLDIFYTARAAKKEFTLDSKEVAAVQWRDPKTIIAEEMAFPSFWKALEVLLSIR